jgi:carbamoyltransferase
VTEEAMLRVAHPIKAQTGMVNLVLAGGVALNCVANGRLLRESPFDGLWIQPAAGDAGGALGAAQFVWYQLLERPRITNGLDSQCGSHLGPRFLSHEIGGLLREKGIAHCQLPPEELFPHVARLLADGQVVGWFQGRMEFGPRALGARSILGDPRSPRMQANLNLKIKFRESFRPFAPAVTQEHASEWFDLPDGQESPYMLLVASVRPPHRLPLSAQQAETMRDHPDLCERLRMPRSTVPAITHVDYSARLQTVDPIRNSVFHRLLREFHKQTGCPMLVNTSFNIRGEPIVCTPLDALRCFQATEMDALVMEDWVIHKCDQAEPVDSLAVGRYRDQFQLD